MTVVRISEEAEADRDLLGYFQRSGLLPGREFDVVEVEPYNALIVLKRDGESVPISLSVARQIWVQRRRADQRMSSRARAFMEKVVSKA